MHEVFAHCETIKGDALVVMLSLADWCNDDHEAWPSLPKLAKKSRVSIPGLCGILKRLEEEGYLEVERHEGRGNCNIYRVHPQKKQLTVLPVSNPDKQVTPLTVSDPDKQLTRNSNSPLVKGETVNPIDINSKVEPITYKVLEPSIEPSIDISILPDPKKNPSSENGKKISEPLQKKKLTQEQADELYWLYPKHEDKADAIRAMEKAFEDIVRGKHSPDGYEGFWPPPDPFVWLKEQVKKYAELRDGEDKKFTPLPATWFNKRKFTNDIDAQLREKRQVNENASHSNNGHAGSFGRGLTVGERRNRDLQNAERQILDELGG